MARGVMERDDSELEAGRDELEPDAGREGVGRGAAGGQVAHDPVLLEEVVGFLARPGARIVDLTLGLGGHAAALLEASGPEAQLLGLDRDREMLDLAAQRLAVFGERVVLRQARASQAGALVEEVGWRGRVTAVLADLGVSSVQLLARDRGFSFESDAPLDMRMDRSGGPTARQLLRRWTRQELAEVLRRYGEVAQAGRVARAIKEADEAGRLRSCRELAEVVAAARPRAKERLHPATQVFMALRIAVNRELEELEAILEQAPRWLDVGGRLAVISFHSLEDRLVKERFRALAEPHRTLPPDLPVRDLPRADFRLVTRKPVRPRAEEAARNSRSRSARLRVIERVRP